MFRTCEMDWLNWMLMINERLNQLCLSDKMTVTPENAEAGDIAIHVSFPNWHLRIVSEYGGEKVYLYRLTKENKWKKYIAKFFRILPINKLI